MAMGATTFGQFDARFTLGQVTAIKSRLTSLPTELLYMVGDHLTDVSDLAAMSKTCQELSPIYTGILNRYRSLVTPTSEIHHIPSRLAPTQAKDNSASDVLTILDTFRVDSMERDTTLIDSMSHQSLRKLHFAFNATVCQPTYNAQASGMDALLSLGATASLEYCSITSPGGLPFSAVSRLPLCSEDEDVDEDEWDAPPDQVVICEEHMRITSLEEVERECYPVWKYPPSRLIVLFPSSSNGKLFSYKVKVKSSSAGVDEFKMLDPAIFYRRAANCLVDCLNHGTKLTFAMDEMDKTSLGLSSSAARAELESHVRSEIYRRMPPLPRWTARSRADSSLQFISMGKVREASLLPSQQGRHPEWLERLRDVNHKLGPE